MKDKMCPIDQKLSFIDSLLSNGGQLSGVINWEELYRVRADLISEQKLHEDRECRYPFYETQDCNVWQVNITHTNRICECSSPGVAEMIAEALNALNE